MGKYVKRILSGVLVLVVVFASDIFPAYASNGNVGENDLNLYVEDDQMGEETFVGDKVTLTAEASGGAGNYEYRFILNLGEQSDIVQDYSDLAEYVFTAEQPGSYVFDITVKDGVGQIASYQYELIVKQPEKSETEESEDTSDSDIISSGDQENSGESDKVLQDQYTDTAPSKSTQTSAEAAVPEKKSVSRSSLQGYLSSDLGNTGNIGQQIVLTALYNGGSGKIEYRFTEEYNGTLTTVQQFSEDNTYEFTASKAGIHTYHLAVRDEGGQTLSTKYSINVVVPSDKKLSGKLVSSKGATANVEDEVTLTADCRGGYGKVEYRFTEVYNGVAKTVQQYSEDPTYTFEAGSPGVHTYHLAVRDEGGQALSTKYSINVVVPSDKKLSGKLVSSKGATANVEDEVTLTADCRGGYGKVEYRFTEVYNGVAKTVQQYSEDPTYTFDASAPGVHTYHLAVRDERGQALSTKYSINVVVPSDKKLSGKLVSSKGATANVEDEVTLTADCRGGYGKVEYRFTEVYNGVAKTVQQYSEDPTYTFDASAPGVHTYHLAVRDERGQALSTQYSINVIVPAEKKLGGALRSNVGISANVGTEVVLYASHTGGYGNIEYRFTEVYNGTAKTVQAYSEKDTYTFRATNPGVHQFNLALRDREGQATSVSYSITVTVPSDKKLYATLTSSKTPREYVDRIITLTAGYSGGYGDVEYRFTEVYNGVAETVQAYSSNNEYTFRTTKPGVHTYYLAVRDKEGQAVNATYSLTVVVHPDYILTGTFTKNVSQNVKENTAVVLTATALKGYGAPYQYRFTETYNGKSTTVQNYSTDNTYEFTIKGGGLHKYTVAIQDCEGQAISYSLTISVGKNGWYYENGYKFYYKNNVKQLDLDGILPRQSSYYIKVNRTACTVTVYAKDGNNGYIIPVKRFACSVGLPSTPTPTGTFYTSNKYRWHTLMGPSYGQYCTRIVGGVLFHSVAGYNMTSYNLKASDYNKLGSPASHGCVRLCVRDAKWIYDNCSSGTMVTIYDSSDPGPLGKPATIKIPASQNWDPTDPNL